MGFDPSTATLAPDNAPVSKGFDPSTAKLWEPAPEPSAPSVSRKQARWDADTTEMPAPNPDAYRAVQEASGIRAPPSPAPIAPTEYGPAPDVPSPPRETPTVGDTVYSNAAKVFGPIAEEAKRGWTDTPRFLNPAAEDWVKQKLGPFGESAIGIINSPANAFALGAAALRGGQKAVMTAMIPILGETGARDMAATIEAFPLGFRQALGVPHVAPLTAPEAAAMRQARSMAGVGWEGPSPETPAQTAGRTERESREAWRADMERSQQPRIAGPVPEAAPFDPATAQPVEPTAPREATRPNTPEQAAMDEEARVQPVQPTEAPTPPESTPTPAAPASGSYVMLKPEQLIVDPKRFQFKTSDERGVTGALEGTDRWEPDLASPIMAWQANDGGLYVADGHQRHDLATRAEAAGQTDVQIPAKIYREADGYTPEHMRVLAAYKNIAEGSGTPIDAAKVLRGDVKLPADRVLPTLPPRSQMVQQGQALAKLSDEAFGVVVNGVVSPAYAAHVGALITDPAEQMGALQILAKAQPANSEQARLIVQDVKNSGFARGTQSGLFGDEDFAKSLIPERARVLDNAMRTLRKVKGVFRAAIEGEESLTGAGNKLDREGNIQGKTENEQLLDILDRSATTRGPISDALNAAARDLADGKPVAAVTSQFLAKTRGLIRSGQNETIRPSDLAGGAGGEGEGPTLGLSERRAPLPRPIGPDLFGTERAQPARREVEPTIKGDQRQITMPGMEPSARQAQASRDAQGPRSNQQPANEGLFAGKETEQPALIHPKRSLLFSGMGGATDLINTIVVRGDPHTTARDWTLRHGRRTGHEYLVGINNNSGEVVHASTSHKKNKAMFNSFPLSIVPEDWITLHHNHPGGGGFSPDDLNVGSIPSVKHIVAHDEADMFSARVPENSRQPGGDSWRKRSIYVANGMRHAQNALRPWLNDMVKWGWLKPEDYTRSYWDLIARMLHAEGLIDYVSTRPVPASIGPGFERFLEKTYGIDDPGRYTHAHSLDEALASLRAPVGGNAESPRADLRGGAGGIEGRTEGQGRAAPIGTQGRLLEEGPTQVAALAPPLPMTGGKPNFDVLTSKKDLPNLLNHVKAGFSPTAIKGARPTEFAIRKHSAEASLAFQRAVTALRDIRESVNRLSKADQIYFTDRMENGRVQKTPALQKVADTLRSILDDWTKKIQNLGPQYLSHAIDNYMGHIWSNYEEWKAGQPAPHPSQGMGIAQAMAQGKSPLRGSGNFLKRRTFPTQLEGINAGLVPVTHNPVDMQLLKIREIQKFYFGTKLAENMKATGMAIWVPKSDWRHARYSGYEPLDDRVFEPEIHGVHPAGPVIPGAYFATEPQARLFNNYMSKGMVGNPWYDMMRASGNALNSLQLLWPGFHTSFVTLDTANSRSALGLQQLAFGMTHLDPKMVGKGLTSVATGVGPGAVVRSLIEGTRLRRAALDPASMSPEYRQLADDLIMGGGRLSMDQFYQSSATGSFIHGWKDFDPRHIMNQVAQMYADAPPGWRKAVLPPIQIVYRSMDTLMHPLMGWLVPRAKLGVFSEMARQWHATNPNATPEARAAAMTTLWDNVEDRLGQMTYDNIFWSKTLKDVAFVSMRSVGWNLGTIRSGAGAAIDTAQFAADAARLRKPEFTGRMAYGITQFMNHALWAAMLTYLFTGSGPETWMDYFFPRTGSLTPEGEPERLAMPTYVKDWIEWATNPRQTATNKIHPLVSLGAQIANNRDYYGGLINPSHIDKDASAVAAYGDFLANSVIPFTARGYARLDAEGASRAAKFMSLFGFQPAPKSITQPERGEVFQTREDIKAYRRLMRENEKGRLHPFTTYPSQPSP